MRIGILGGTFNPVHLGHIRLAETAQKKLNLNKIFFIPANIAPLKSKRGLISGKERLMMLRLATKKNKRFKISSLELKRGGISYSMDTLRQFKKKFPKDKIFFITGSDSLRQLDKWKDFDQIKHLSTFVVAKRSGFNLKRKSGIRFIQMNPIDISSSMIRSYLKRNKPVINFLDKKVLNYIREKGLYR
ncbi:MAG: nicotinate-nucleotide adenylyltransferase [Candidatus Omnitrophota bacterium]